MNDPMFGLLIGIIVGYVIGCLIFGIAMHYYNEEAMKRKGIEFSLKEKIIITFFWPILLLRM